MEMVQWHGHSVGRMKWRDEEGSRETSQETTAVVPS